VTSDRRPTNDQTVNDGVAHSKNPKKCAYHVTFDLDLEHTQDAGLPGDHRVQVWWRFGYLSARRSDLRKSLQTDGRTDDGRRAIALAHSWNELKISNGHISASGHPIHLMFGAIWRGFRGRRIELRYFQLDQIQ